MQNTKGGWWLERKPLHIPLLAKCQIKESTYEFTAGCFQNIGGWTAWNERHPHKESNINSSMKKTRILLSASNGKLANEISKLINFWKMSTSYLIKHIHNSILWHFHTTNEQ